MTDADVDGSHIRTLLLTFFFRQMPELVRQSKIFIAQPPLYLIKRGKRSEYVLNEKRMAEVLRGLGLDAAELIVNDDAGAEEARLTGDHLQKVFDLLSDLEDKVEVLQRRGIDVNEFVSRHAADPAAQRRVPRIVLQRPAEQDLYFWTEEDEEAYRAEHDLQEIDPELDEDAAANGTNGDGRRVIRHELHEAKQIDRIFTDLSAFGLTLDDYTLVREQSVSGEETPTKFVLHTTTGKGESHETRIANLAAVVPAVLESGKRGISIKRFKGLGEMDADQLWDTTMDPTKRVLLRVTWDAASDADALFSILMGEDVEPRRKYIEEHALEVKNLDV
jgi:DNA gyrase subunit B